MRYLYGLFLVLATPLLASSLPCAPEDLDCRIRAVTVPYDQRGVLSGCLLVERNFKSAKLCFGDANDEGSEPNNESTRFLIASLSKGYVAAAILRLKDQGKLQLTDLLSSYIPEYPRKNLKRKGNREVTLYDLLTHTSGIPEAYLTPEIENALGKMPLGFQEILNSIKSTKLHFSPGTRFEYSNTGYLLLGEVVRRIAGVSYTEFMETNFFKPLGLKETSVGFPMSESPARSYEGLPPHRKDFLRHFRLTPLVTQELFSDTNIVSTAKNLVQWVKVLTSGAVLTKESTLAMFTPHLENYGLGWITYTDGKDNSVYEHAGSFVGYQSMVRRYPGQNTTLVWLSNQSMEESQFTRFFDEISEAALPE